MPWELLVSAQACVQVNSTLVIVNGKAYGIESSSCPIQLLAACEYHCTELTLSSLKSGKDNTEQENGLCLSFQSP